MTGMTASYEYIRHRLLSTPPGQTHFWRDGGAGSGQIVILVRLPPKSQLLVLVLQIQSERDPDGKRYPYTPLDACFTFTVSKLSTLTCQ